MTDQDQPQDVVQEGAVTETSTGYKAVRWILVVIGLLVLLCILCIAGAKLLNGVGGNATASLAEETAEAPDDAYPGPNDRMAPEGATEVVVTRVVVESLEQAVEADPAIVLADNEEVISNYTNPAGPHQVAVKEDEYMIISADPGCVQGHCFAQAPGFTGLVYGPMTVTLQIPFGTRHINASVVVYNSGDPLLELAMVQYSDQKALAFSLAADGTLTIYDPYVGDGDQPEDLQLTPINPAGEVIRFVTNFESLEDVASATAEEALEAVVPGDPCAFGADGAAVTLTGKFWLSTDGPVTYTVNGETWTQIGGHSAYSDGTTSVTISDYPVGVTRICSPAENYGLDGKAEQVLFGNIANEADLPSAP